MWNPFFFSNIFLIHALALSTFTCIDSNHLSSFHCSLVIYRLPAYCNMYLCVRNIECLHVLMIRIANCFPSIWRLMWALLHQMAERKSPRVCSYTSWVSQNENPIFLSLVSLNFLCFKCQTSCLNILCLGCLTSCKSWIAVLTPPFNF